MCSRTGRGAGRTPAWSLRKGETLLIDTLMSVPLTRDMLAAFAKVPGGAQIDRLMNTHANPDHFFGNGLVEGAEIIATAKTRAEMEGFNPQALANLSANWQTMGEAGEFLFETMGRYFDFSGVDELTLPTTTFDETLTLTVGDKTVELTDLGPAHTESDTIAWVEEDRTVFTGDLLFNEGHPVVWAGPLANWIAACDFIIALDPEVVVPGHGPICDVEAVRTMKGYFEHLRDEARGRFDAGMDWREAARDIPIKEYAHWTDPGARRRQRLFALQAVGPGDPACAAADAVRRDEQVPQGTPSTRHGCGHAH